MALQINWITDFSFFFFLFSESFKTYFYQSIMWTNPK